MITTGISSRHSRYDYASIPPYWHNSHLITHPHQGSNDTLDWVDHDLRSSPFKYHRRCTVDKASGATLREFTYVSVLSSH